MNKPNRSIEYNANNQLTKIVDPKGGTYEYTYTDNNKRIVDTAKTQQGAVYDYDYDSRGSVTKLEGTVTDNDLGTLKIKSEQSIDYPTPTESTYSVTTTDTRGNTSSATYNAKTGTLVQSSDYGIEIDYTYNGDNDLLSSVTKYNSSVSYSYKDNKYLEDVSSSTVDYHFDYDSFGNRTDTEIISQDPTGPATTLASYDYNTGGQLTQMTYGNGDYVTYSYDDSKTNGIYQKGGN